MSQAIVIHGRYAERSFIPSEPLPAVEGKAELIVFPEEGLTPSPRPSIFDHIGKAPILRSAADIEAQISAERAAWGDR